MHTIAESQPPFIVCLHKRKLLGLFTEEMKVHKSNALVREEGERFLSFSFSFIFHETLCGEFICYK
jgi:hypothetical protein